LKRGQTYAFRYRAHNLYGWSDYSPVSYLLVADKPSVAAKPQFSSADNNNIYVLLNLNTENNGSEILKHEMSVSVDGVSYTTLIGYDGLSTSYTLNKVVDQLVTGEIYRIRMRAQNDVGYGEWSSDLLAAMTAPPQPPTNLVKDT